MISDNEDNYKVWLVKPRLRPIEVFPVQNGEERAICLRDPSRISPKPLFLSPAAVTILAMLDGRNDLRDIQTALFKAYQELVSLANIDRLIRVLDENIFLEGETYERFLDSEKENFASALARPAYLAGQSYPADPQTLTREIETYFHHPKGPGPDKPEKRDMPPRGLVAPHIDFPRGGPCYAWAYQWPAAGPQPGLAVILGTAHSATKNLFALCDKDFETPHGLATCEKDLAASLLDRLGPSIIEDRFVHRGEHSVEFQAVWLLNRISRPEEMKILPILCGSFYQLMAQGLTPEDHQEYTKTIEVLKELLGQWAAGFGPVTIVASADLSHVGRQFGDNFPITPQLQEEIKDYDLKLLEKACRGDARAFFRQAAEAGDRTHVCGLAPIYTLIKLLEGSQGKILAYDQWTDENGQGLVSFASLVFPGL